MELEKKKKRWEVKYKGKKASSLSKVISILLENRGLTTKIKQQEFFNPTSPYRLSLSSLGIDKEQVLISVQRILKAKNNSEQVIIYGDYDADGICGSSILWECLYACNLEVLPYIPDRFSDGYGLKYQSVCKLKKKYSKLKLIITVDNGIVANKEVEKIKSLGIDVVITDHHQVGKKLPKALAIIHTDKLSGAAVAWILAREISKELKIAKSRFNIEKMLDMAAIGTISDQMLLVGENRSFAKHGLIWLNKTENLGLKAMFGESQITMGEIGTYEINYIISPRINAVGRISHALESMRLLCTRNMQRAHQLALHLGKVNRERQRIVDESVLLAKRLAEKEKKEKVIIIAHPSFNEGVVGLVAGKLVEEYFRPVIVFSKGKVVSKASARSINGFNVIATIRENINLTEEAGGHPMAAGLTVKTIHLDMFKRKFLKQAEKKITENMLVPRLKIDLEIGFEVINPSLISALKRMEPTGIGNYPPVFLSRRVKVFESRLIGKDKHLRLVLNQKRKVLDGVAFNMGNLASMIVRGSYVDLVYTIEENTWQGKKDIQLMVKDMLLSEEE